MQRVLLFSIIVVGIQQVEAWGQGAVSPIIWTSPKLFTPANSSAAEWKIVFGPNDLTFYVTTERDGHFAESDIYLSQRADGVSPWSSPANLTVLNSGLMDVMSWISPDGMEGFLSRRTGPGDGDISRTTRDSMDDPWGTPSLVPELNTDAEDGQLALTADGLVGVFLSDRDEGLGGLDVWQTSRPNLDSAWSEPVNLSELNSPAQEANPFFSADGLTIFYGSNRAGGVGNFDIYVAQRPSLNDAFLQPTLVPGINTTANDGNPVLSANGILYWASLRSGGSNTADIWFSVQVCEGDANADGVIDPADMGFVQARYGCLIPDDGLNCLKADVNQDGKVDPADAGFVQARFGVKCSGG